MLSNSASGYFGDLNLVLRNLEATNRSGMRMGLDEGAGQAIALLASVKSRGSKVMLVGNGGSAAIVSHIQNDFCKAAGMPAMVFNDLPLLTAFANDDGYQVAFANMAAMWAKPGDLLLAVSSSGMSPNILRAASVCLENGCDLITMTGFSPLNELRKLGGLNFYVPANSYGTVELAHAILGHFLTDAMAQGTGAAKVSDWTAIPAMPALSARSPAPALKPVGDGVEGRLASIASQGKT